MGVIFTQHVTDHGGGFFCLFVGSQTCLVHGIENAAMDRLQAVTDIGQGSAYDDGHGIVDITGLHFLHQLRLNDILIGE